MSRGPDFIVIGAMKCATSTLHLQLAAQPGIFMSLPKEPCFFSDDPIYARGWPWYEALFAGAAPADLCGESSTHYTKLPTYPHAVGRIARHLPNVKLIYVMRHPLERLVSQYVHEWTERMVDGPIDQAVQALPILTEYSRYAMQLEPYLDVFGPERVLPLFVERLRAEPQSELERIAAFIGYSGDARWDSTLEDDNVSARRMRTAPLRDAVVELPGLRQLRRRFIPQTLRDRVKRWWMMEQKPQLGDETRSRLAEVFDADLAKLGRWLGVTLNCDNFKDQVRRSPLIWQSFRAGVVR